MSVTLTIDGVSKPFPTDGEANWGAQVTEWAQLITNKAITPGSGSSKPLTAELNFGTVYGVKLRYITSTNHSGSGSEAVNLAKTDKISWQNVTGTTSLRLETAAGNKLAVSTFDSSTNTITGTNVLVTQADIATKRDLSDGTFNADLVAPYYTTGAGGRWGAVQIPSGSTAQRPTGSNGLIRYNSQTLNFEGYGNGAWANLSGGGGGSSSVATLTDVQLTSLATNQTLSWNGTKWVNVTPSGGGASALSGLTDVLLSAPLPSEVLSWNGTKWVNAPRASGGATELTALTDVQVSAPAANQVLQYNGTKWVNAAVAGGGSAGATVSLNTALISNQTLTTVMTDWTNASINLTTGTWQVTALVGVNPQLSTSSATFLCFVTARITDASNVQQAPDNLAYIQFGASSAFTAYSDYRTIPFSFVTTVAATPRQLKIRLSCSVTGGATVATVPGMTTFYAVRIA